MFMGLGMPVPEIANIPGPSRPGYPSGEKNMKFEVEVTEGSLDIGWYMDGRTFTGGGSGWSYGMDIDWGDGTSTGELPYVGQTNRLVSHTYSDPGTYTITINWENAFAATNAYYAPNFDQVSTANALKVKKWLSWGTDFVLGGTVRMFQLCGRLIYEAKDFPITYTPMTGQNWLQTFGSTNDWNTPINLSDWSVSKWTGTSRYSSTFREMFNLPELKLENETINSGTSINPFRDGGMTDNVGRDTAGGCKFQFNNINFEGAGANGMFGNALFRLSYVHKESSFTNWTYDNSVSAGGYVQIYNMFNASKVKNLSDNENLTIDLSGWKDKNNTSLGLFVGGLCSSGFIKDGLTNVTGTLTINFTSPYGIDLHVDTRNMFYNLNGSKWSGLTIIGAGNWTINNLTGTQGVRNMFFNCGTLDVDLTNFDFTGVNYINTFMSGNTKLTTARYDEALIAWDNSGVQNIVNLKMNLSQYTAGGTAETAKNNLINNKGWSITDGGPA
jgi:hypothetical protein